MRKDARSVGRAAATAAGAGRERRAGGSGAALRGTAAAGGRAFREGLRDLVRHRPDLAMRSFRAAVDDCPASAPSLLSERLYWLALSLLRLDRVDLAVKSLASAQKLRPRGFVRRAYERRANGYGMPRRQSPEVDDFYAFYAVQTCRYLGARPGRRFASVEEKDAVTRLIAEAWLSLKASGRLLEKDTGAKLGIFKACRIAFPGIVRAGPDYPADQELFGAGRSGSLPACGETTEVDFRKGKILKAQDRCSCGSGLPYCQCCGRTKSPCELQP